jgi:hypothetical protein
VAFEKNRQQLNVVRARIVMVKPVLQARAQRFPIEAFVRFRESGEARWSEGTTVNISRSGVLFSSPKILPPKTKIEMRIVLPRALIVCRGSIVRTESTVSRHANSVLAAAILQYSLTHSKAKNATNSAN